MTKSEENSKSNSNEDTDFLTRALEGGLLVNAIEREGENSNRTSDPLRNCVSLQDNFLEVDWKATQQADPEIGKIQDNLSQNNRPTANDISHLGREYKAYWSQWPSLTLHDDVVYRTHTNKLGEEQFQIIVPKVVRNTVLKYVHDHKTAGHLGKKKTYQRLK